VVRGGVVVVVLVRSRVRALPVVVDAWRCSTAGGGGIGCKGAIRCATSEEVDVERAL